MPPNTGVFPIYDHPKIFFKNWAPSILYPYGALTSCKKLEKTNELSLRYRKIPVVSPPPNISPPEYKPP